MIATVNLFIALRFIYLDEFGINSQNLGSFYCDSADNWYNTIKHIFKGAQPWLAINHFSDIA